MRAGGWAPSAVVKVNPSAPLQPLLICSAAPRRTHMPRTARRFTPSYTAAAAPSLCLQLQRDLCPHVLLKPGAAAQRRRRPAALAVCWAAVSSCRRR